MLADGDDEGLTGGVVGSAFGPKRVQNCADVRPAASIARRQASDAGVPASVVLTVQNGWCSRSCLPRPSYSVPSPGYGTARPGRGRAVRLAGRGEGLAVRGDLRPELAGRELRIADRLRADVVDLLGERGELRGGLSATHLGAEVHASLQRVGHRGSGTLLVGCR